MGLLEFRLEGFCSLVWGLACLIACYRLAGLDALNPQRPTDRVGVGACAREGQQRCAWVDDSKD